MPRGRNVALLGSFVWRLGRDDRPWSRILRPTLGEDGSRRGGKALNSIALKHGALVCEMRERWVLGDGSKVNFLAG